MTPPPATPANDYRLAGLLSLGVLAVGLAGRGDATLPLLWGGLAAANLWFPRPWGPFAVLAGVVYMLIFPFGVPDFGMTADHGVRPGDGFRGDDLIVLAAAAVHLQCQFRGLGFARRILPADDAGLTKPLPRPADFAAPSEYPEALAAALGGVLAGQVAWWLLTSTKIDLLAVPPIRALAARPGRDALELDSALGRTVLAVSLFAAAGMLARFGFWLARWGSLGGAEARMALLDVQWREGRRELNRQEAWRAWGRRKRLDAARAERRPPERDDIPTWRRLILGFEVFLLVFLSVRLYFQLS